MDVTETERQRRRSRQNLVVGLVLGGLLLAAILAPWGMIAASDGPETRRTPAAAPTAVPMQPTPEVSPEFVTGFAAPRGRELSAVFTLEQALAASQQIADLSVQAAGPIDDPNIAPGTTSFPVYPVECLDAPGGQADYEVWFTVADATAGIARVRALWEANGYTLDPTSSDGRYGYVGDPAGPVDLVSIEDKSGTIKLRVASVCAAGAGF